MPQRTPEEKKAYQKEYREKNREKKNASNKAYRERNKETINRKRWEDPEDIKSRRLYNWKNRGLVGDYDALYEIYLNTKNCMRCSIQFSQEKRSSKCMDHDHETNEYRAILCHYCNTTLPRQKSKEEYIIASS